MRIFCAENANLLIVRVQKIVNGAVCSGTEIRLLLDAVARITERKRT